MTATVRTTDTGDGPERVADDHEPRPRPDPRDRRVQPSPPPTFRTTSSTRFLRSLERLPEPS